MYAKMRRQFSGEFIATDRGNGAWQLDSAVPHETSVYLQSAEPHAAQAFAATPIHHLDIEWREDSVRMSFTSGDGLKTVKAAGAIVHEPLRRLYDGLPLQSIDDNARRFWRRVFRLVRMPGGRFLLGLLTRTGKH
ncbi:MAG TPA: hypothetical protein VGI65_03400 [Steroidobacteraceae bacterium]|jgi:hypothetical protein